MSKLASCSRSCTNLEHLCKCFEALNLLHREGNSILEHSIASLVQESSALENLSFNRKLHSLGISYGFASLAYLGDHIIRVFASCGSLLEASLVFCKVTEPSVYTWQAIISAHLQQEENALALFLYHQMQHLGTHPNKFIFTGGLQACIALGDIQEGKHIHGHMIKCGSEIDSFVESVLVDMYMKCGNLDDARKIFNLSKAPDNALWSVMISGYAQRGHGVIALELFHHMQKHGEVPNHYTFSCALKACSSLEDIHRGTQIHNDVVKSGLESDLIVGNALICMYTTCKRLDDAHFVFVGLSKKTIVSWGTMIAGYALHGHGLSALQLLMDMQHASMKPNRAIYLYSLKACSSILAIKKGMVIHDLVLKGGLESDVAIGSGLVDVYSKCGCLKEGHKVHNSLPDQSLVSWGAIIHGYAHHGHGLLAFELFKQVQHEGLLLDRVLYLCSIKACGSIGDVRVTKLLHVQILANELVSSDEAITNALLDAYTKCRDMGEACKFFSQNSKQSLVSFSSMIGAYTEHGHNLLALGLYNDIRQKRIKLDRVLYLSVMKACANLGVLTKAKQIHDDIIRSGVDVDMDIGNSLVNMYAKCGVLLEAAKVLDGLRTKDEFSWGAMISGLADHGHSEHVKQCLEDMQQQGVKPTGAIYSSILSACSRVGAVEEGLQFFDSMRGQHGILPDAEHITCSIDLLCRAGLLNEARQLLDTNNLVDVTGWTSLLSAYRLYGNMNLRIDCNYQMSKPDQALIPSPCITTYSRGLPTSEEALVSKTGLLNEVTDFQKSSFL